MSIYLYVKTHRKTGLKYLGKTKQDPYKYSGSGKHWKRHLKVHGTDIDTEIIRECQTPEEVREWGLYYSELWNVVESDAWANLREEDGVGAGSWLQKILNQRPQGHPFKDSEAASRWQKSRVEAGTHHLLSGDIQSATHSRRVAEGIHNFQTRSDGTSLTGDRVKDGTHNWLRKPDGSHLKPQNLAYSTDANPNKRRVSCLHCHKETTAPALSQSHRDGECIARAIQREQRRKDKTAATLWQCQVCGVSGRGQGNFTRWHSGGKCIV